MSLTQARLKQLLRYDPKMGEFYWRVQSGTRADLAGKRAGRINRSLGYWIVGIGGTHYYAHRLVWLYKFGRFPKKEIDHKNKNRADNKISNLREASRTQNNANAKNRSDNTSGIRGVYQINKSNWRARIKSNNKSLHLGCFSTAKEARAAYHAAAKKLHGEFFSLEA